SAYTRLFRSQDIVIGDASRGWVRVAVAHRDQLTCPVLGRTRDVDEGTTVGRHEQQLQLDHRVGEVVATRRTAIAAIMRLEDRLPAILHTGLLEAGPHVRAEMPRQHVEQHTCHEVDVLELHRSGSWGGCSEGMRQGRRRPAWCNRSTEEAGWWPRPGRWPDGARQDRPARGRAIPGSARCRSLRFRQRVHRDEGHRRLTWIRPPVASSKSDRYIEGNPELALLDVVAHVARSRRSSSRLTRSPSSSDFA